MLSCVKTLPSSKYGSCTLALDAAVFKLRHQLSHDSIYMHTQGHALPQCSQTHARLTHLRQISKQQGGNVAHLGASIASVVQLHLVPCQVYLLDSAIRTTIASMMATHRDANVHGPMLAAHGHRNS